MLKKIATYWLLVFVVHFSYAQVEIKVHLDKAEYAIGDYINVDVEVIGDSTLNYYWPGSDEMAPYELITVNPTDTAIVAGKRVLHQKIVYSIYDADKYYFPTVTIPFKKPNDNSAYFASSDSIPFVVNGMAVDTTAAFKPIKDIKDVKVTNHKALYIFLIINAIIAIGFLIYFFVFKKNKKLKSAAADLPKISLFDFTMQQFNNLAAKKLWQQDQVKLYYSELTDILRTYLEKRFSINAMESTSDEIIEQLQNIPTANTLTGDVEYILRLADMAKFAKSIMLANENEKALELAKHFVTATQIEETEKPTTTE